MSVVDFIVLVSVIGLIGFLYTFFNDPDDSGF
jgi:hypothetical protein